MCECGAGAEALLEGHPEEALLCYCALIEQYPYDAALYCARAHAHLAHRPPGDPEQADHASAPPGEHVQLALADALKCTELQPGWSEGYAC